MTYIGWKHLAACVVFTFITARYAHAETAEVIMLPADITYAGNVLNPGQRIGAIEFRGAWTLASANPAFGGLSTIGWTKDRNLLALSDKGSMVLLPIGGKNLASVTRIQAVIEPLLDAQGKPLAGSADDSESIVVYQDNTALISFERQHRIERYSLATRRPSSALPLPDELVKSLEFNGGFEAITELPSGSVLAFAEGGRDEKGYVRGWLIDKKGGVQQVAYELAWNFSLSDIAVLPNGDVLAIERGVGASGMKCTPRRIRSADIRPGQVIKGEALISLDGRSGIGNTEGVAVSAMADGTTRILLMSDNNFSANTKTMLTEWHYRPAP